MWINNKDEEQGERKSAWIQVWRKSVNRGITFYDEVPISENGRNERSEERRGEGGETEVKSRHRRRRIKHWIDGQRRSLTKGRERLVLLAENEITEVAGGNTNEGSGDSKSCKEEEEKRNTEKAKKSKEEKERRDKESLKTRRGEEAQLTEKRKQTKTNWNTVQDENQDGIEGEKMEEEEEDEREEEIENRRTKAR